MFSPVFGDIPRLFAYFDWGTMAKYGITVFVLDYAARIGTDAYEKNAMEDVRCAENLM